MGVKKRYREPMNWVTIVWIEVPTTFYLPHKQYLGCFFLNHKWLPDFSIPQSYSWFFVCKTNVGYFLVLVYCSVRWVFVNFFCILWPIYTCVHTLTSGKSLFVIRFWVVSAFLISVIDHEIPLIISCHQRGSTIGVVSKSD